MPTLKDIVGSLLKDITAARMIADQQSAEIAGKYAEHPLLRMFPVPNMTIKNMEIDLRFAVERTGTSGNGKEMDLDVIIEREHLEKVPAQQISSIKLTISTSDLQLAALSDGKNIISQQLIQK